MKSSKVRAAIDYKNLVGLGMFACSVFVANVLLSIIDLAATELIVPVCNSSLCCGQLALTNTRLPAHVAY